jgi:integrase
MAKEESKDKNTLFLFPGIHGSCYSDSAFKSAWTRVSQEIAKQGFTRFQFKDLRAKHATDLEEMGGDATDNLAHGNRGTTTRHYIRRKKVVPLR